jgi:outer membrane protein assembly factor BamE (lipoprotein component of BamABCDE complex)
MARTGSPALIVFVALGLAACTPEISTHGYRFDEAALAQLETGRTTRDQTLQLLGSPSSVATFDDKIWYYVSQRTERMSFYQEQVVEQQVIEIAFDDNGVIRSIDRDNLDDAREVALVERTTPTSGSELSLIQQFLGNLGRFNPQQDADAPSPGP